METSPQIQDIAKALITFHKEVGVIKKSEANPFFKSKYADLPAILSGIEGPLQAAGLSFAQFPVNENELETILMHAESGQWMRGKYRMTPAKNDPQGQGSVITYQRRYALGAILGLNIDDDDDGNAASTPSKAPVRPATARGEEKGASAPSDDSYAKAKAYIASNDDAEKIKAFSLKVQAAESLIPEQKAELAELANQKIMDIPF